MLILYVHAHMHVGTRVWLAPTCEWVWYTLGGREGKERSQRSGGHARRTVDRYSNGPFVPAQLARPASRIHSDNDDNDDNGDNDEYDERGVLSLSLSLFSSSHLPSWWLIQWSSREAALVDSCSLFPWLFVAFGLDHRKSSSIVRFFRKLAVPVLLGSKGDYTWRRFFFERERYDRSRNISTASGAEFWDEYRSGFGWRRRN